MYYVKHTYPTLWTVGCDSDDGWIAEGSYESSENAYDRVRYLNGGGDPSSKPVEPPYAPDRRDYFLAHILNGLMANPGHVRCEPSMVVSIAVEQLETFLDDEALNDPIELNCHGMPED